MQPLMVLSRLPWLYSAALPSDLRSKRAIHSADLAPTELASVEPMIMHYITSLSLVSPRVAARREAAGGNTKGFH